MMQFQYTARDMDGRLRQGEVTAENADDAQTTLRQDGLCLVSLEESVADGGLSSSSRRISRRVSRSEIIYLTTELAVMIESGVPLASTLEGLATTTTNPRLKSILLSVQRSVEGGSTLSDALAAYPKEFDGRYISLIRASEASGTMAEMLERIAVQARGELETRQKVRGAAMYPAAMFVMCVGVCLFLLTYVFPKITPLFASRNIELPLPTRVMMVASDAVISSWHWLTVGAAVVIAFLCYSRQTTWGRSFWDWSWLNVPVLGPVMHKLAISRSLRTLASTINAGVPVLQAIELSAGSANNVYFLRAWENVAELVSSGREMHEALATEPLFPATLLQMVASGEQTGKLGPVLMKVSDYFESEVNAAVKSATSLLEPLLVAMMGGVIGTIALAMLLPIFKLSGHTG